MEQRKLKNEKDSEISKAATELNKIKQDLG